MTPLAVLFIGFSIFSAAVLAATHFRCVNYPGQTLARNMGLVLVAALVLVQFAHFGWLYLGRPWIEAPWYRFALFCVAPSFFLFSRPLLRPRHAEAKLQPVFLLHATPAAISLALPASTALPLAFAVGAGYLLWLGASLYALRGERSHFRLEILLLGAVFVIAVGVWVLGLMQAALAPKLFYSLYATAIGLAFLLVQTVLGLRPQLSNEVREMAQATYATSTLNHVDCDAVLGRLTALMQDDRLFTDPDLSLASLAGQLGLSGHQLSEFMNVRLGKGFARYLREQRIAAAARMLCAEPSASVLSVGLATGFTSQSTFYEAFREIEGMTPGRYRKLHLGAEAVAG